MRALLAVSLLACSAPAHTAAPVPAPAPLTPAAVWRAIDPARPFLAAAVRSAEGNQLHCAVSRAGDVACWGRVRPASHDALAGRSSPFLLDGVHGATDVETDGLIVCAVQRSGVRSCFDLNGAGRPPVDIAPVDGDDSCQVGADGSVSCAGENDYGQLGDGHPIMSLEPQRVATLTGMVELRVSHRTSCTVNQAGKMWCWGFAPLMTTGEVTGALGWGQILAGLSVAPPRSVRVVAPSIDGVVWEASQPEPLVGGPVSIATFAIDRVGSLCLVDGGGTLHCLFSQGEDGPPGTWRRMAAPGKVVDLRPLSGGFCVRLDDGQVACLVDERWEDDPDSVDGPPKAQLELVPGIRDATQIAAAQSEACALTAAAQVWCWREDVAKPWEMTTLRGATFIAANHLHQCAIVDGAIWCWGDNAAGQLGDGTTGNAVAEPVRARTSFRAVQVGVGRDSTCALDDQGRIWCWGSDVHGELGSDRPLRSEAPVRVVGLGSPPAPARD